MSRLATTTRLEARTRVLATASLMAIVLGALAAPTAAQAPPLLAIVNGIPGTTVEVCIGNQEVRSELAYGRWFVPKVGTGNRSVSYRLASTGDCTGTLLGRERLALDEGDDLTLVGTGQGDRVVVFDNSPQPRDPDTAWWLAFRNASDIGEVAFATETQGIEPPDLPRVFAKGDSSAITGSDQATFGFGATRGGQGEPMVEGRFAIVDGLRGEAIVVGGNAENAQVVYVARGTKGKPPLQGTCPICGGRVFR